MNKFGGLVVLLIACAGFGACAGNARPRSFPDVPETIRRQVVPVLAHEWVENKGRHEAHVVIRWITPNPDGSDRIVWEGTIPSGRPVWVPKIQEGMVVEGYFSARTTDITHTRGEIERVLIFISPTENGWVISCGPGPKPHC